MTKSLEIEIDLFHALGAVVHLRLNLQKSIQERRHLFLLAVPDPVPLVVEGD